MVSIHAPRAGRDHTSDHAVTVMVVSIHAPHAGRDRKCPPHRVRRPRFNPRAPCGARRTRRVASHTVAGFNPRAPCGARLTGVEIFANTSMFQSTRPVWGATYLCNSVLDLLVFQSTRPVWGATCYMPLFFTNTKVSIHAPRVGRDARKTCGTWSREGFNPRAPCGARQVFLRFLGVFL